MNVEEIRSLLAQMQARAEAGEHEEYLSKAKVLNRKVGVSMVSPEDLLLTIRMETARHLLANQ